ncbi:MAG: heavy metal sensor histidine kinase [Acidobacteriia bacterium]|nr:heavy metal sensor histidine kinase [Terriglobia bacterium]
MSSKKVSSRSWSLATRLTTWYTVASLLLAVFTMGSLYWWLAAYLTQREDRVLIERVQVLRAILRDRPQAILELRQEVDLNSPIHRRDDVQVYVRLLDEHGQPSLTTEGMDALLPPRAFTLVVPVDSQPSHVTDVQSLEGTSYRALAARASVGGSGEKTWLVQAARDREHHKLLLANYRRGLLMMLAITVIACPLVAYFLARRGLQPVREISDTARHIGSATLSARIEAAGYPVELGTLADTFNAMLDRLEDSFRRISQFSADIAHELRTPIHNLRGEAEVTLSRARSIDEYKEALTSCLEETVRLSDLIGRLLFLARAENPGTQLERENVNLTEELAAVREYYANAASEAGVALSTAAGGDVVVAVDRGLLRGAIANLVANSLTHTPPGGSITLAAQVDDGHARIEVCDTGTGIPTQDLPRVFDRFYRADRSRSSQPGNMGLGLAIVKGIVTLHGGQTAIESEVGKGTRVTLTFPMSARPQDRESRRAGPSDMMDHGRVVPIPNMTKK